MKNYTIELASMADMARYRLAVEAVDHFPKKDSRGEWWRCHEVARAVAIVITGHDLPVTVVDGTFCSIDHSWLSWRDPESNGLRILDPYCIGSFPQVRLLFADWSLRASLNCYQPDHGLARLDIESGLVEELLASVPAVDVVK